LILIDDDTMTVFITSEAPGIQTVYGLRIGFKQSNGSAQNYNEMIEKI